MENVSLEWLGQQIERLLSGQREIAARLERIEAGLDRMGEEMTVLTGAFMRQDRESEGDRLAAAGLLALTRRQQTKIDELERRIAALETTH